jgi:hypothetical protein
VLESRKKIITGEAEMTLPITCNSRARELICKSIKSQKSGYPLPRKFFEIKFKILVRLWWNIVKRSNQKHSFQKASNL